MKGILFICTRQKAICIFNNFPLSASLFSLCGTFCLEKDDFPRNISSWCMPQLERFLLISQVFYPYVQGKKHSVSSTIFLYLQLSYALYGTFFQKKMIFHDIFQVGACPNLKDSLLYAGFLFICTRHETFGIFNIFPLSATPLCPVRYIFLKKMNF